MDRRREPRIETYQTVRLTPLCQGGHAIAAHAIELSSHGMRLVLEHPIAVNTVVKVQAADWMVLGDVCYCRLERSHYKVGLALEQALMGLREISEFKREWCDETDRVLLPH